MTQTFIFIYAREGKIKALSLEDTPSSEDNLDGWVHTATLDVCKYLEYLHNDCKYVKKEIKSLNKKYTK